MDSRSALESELRVDSRSALESELRVDSRSVSVLESELRVGSPSAGEPHPVGSVFSYRAQAWL